MDTIIQSHIRKVVLERGQQRHAMRQQSTIIALTPPLPNTEAIKIPTIREACYELYMATLSHYRVLRDGGVPMPREAAQCILTLHNAMHSDDAEQRYNALSAATRYFAGNHAGKASAAISEALRSAWIALTAWQDSRKVTAVHQADAWAR